MVRPGLEIRRDDYFNPRWKSHLECSVASYSSVKLTKKEQRHAISNLLDSLWWEVEHAFDAKDEKVSDREVKEFIQKQVKIFAAYLAEVK